MIATNTRATVIPMITPTVTPAPETIVKQNDVMKHSAPRRDIEGSQRKGHGAHCWCQLKVIGPKNRLNTKTMNVTEVESSRYITGQDFSRKEQQDQEVISCDIVLVVVFFFKIRKNYKVCTVV